MCLNLPKPHPPQPRKEGPSPGVAGKQEALPAPCSAPRRRLRCSPPSPRVRLLAAPGPGRPFPQRTARGAGTPSRAGPLGALAPASCCRPGARDAGRPASVGPAAEPGPSSPRRPSSRRRGPRGLGHWTAARHGVPGRSGGRAAASPAAFRMGRNRRRA